VKRFVLLFALAALLAGCGTDDGRSQQEIDADQALKLGKVSKVLACYTDEAGDDGYVCWVRFEDGSVCLRSDQGGDVFIYSDCRGGFADTLDGEQPSGSADEDDTFDYEEKR
jgi:hypothetical protein